MSLAHKNIQTKLTKGLLDLIILQILDTHPMHGYELMVTIHKFYGVKFGASTIYPVLGTMEKKKYIKCSWNMNGDRPKKVYALTNDGKSMLNYTTGSLNAICKMIGTDTNHTRSEDLHFKVVESSKPKEHYAVFESKSAPN
jgi:DNA-binding PadR family transcriptional regulator